MPHRRSPEQIVSEVRGGPFDCERENGVIRVFRPEGKPIVQEIRVLLAIARSRLNRERVCAYAAWIAVPLGMVLILLAVADRLGPQPIVPWIWVLPVIVSVSVLLIAFHFVRGGESDEEIAAEVDRRLDLRDRFTTALAFRDRDEAFAQAAVADAVRLARLPQTRERVRRFFPVTSPKQWWHGPGLGVIAAGLLLLPQLSMLGGDEDDLEQAMLAAAEVRDEVDSVVQRIAEMSQLREELGDMLDQMGDAKEDMRSGMGKAEEIRRDGVRRMTDLAERLDELVRGERGQTLDALERMTAKLDVSDSGLARDMADAIRAGDFAAAAEALERMMEQLREGMDPEAAAAMAEAVADIAKQLEALAQQQQALEEALAQAGLDPDLAGGNLQDLERAIEQAQGMTDAQKQQLRDLARAQAQACAMCQGLGQALQDAAQAMAGGDADGAQAAAEQLGRMEALQELIRQAQAAQGMCENPGAGMGRGLGLAQAIEQWRQGGGMGERGIGAGGRAELAPTPTQRVAVREQVEVGEGEMIARMLVEGVPVRGESKARLIEVVARASRGLEEAINEESLPRRYHEAQKHYFGELEARARALRERSEPASDGDSE